MEWILIVTHIVFIILTSYYGLIFSKTKLDYIYLVLMFIILFHWTFLNGECFMTYYFKKLKDPNYIAGQDLHKDELKIVFIGYEELVQLFVIINNIFSMISVYIVCQRIHIPIYLSIIFITLFEVYFYSLYFFKDHYKNDNYQLFQETMKYVLIIYAIVFLKYMF